MKHILLIIFIVILAGCSTNQNVPMFYAYEPTHVPLCYRISSNNEEPGILTDEERFISMYDSARWLVIHEYVKNINYKLSPSFLPDHCYGGWPSALEGFEVGMNETNDLIQANIRYYGKKQTQQSLVKLWENRTRIKTGED